MKCNNRFEPATSTCHYCIHITYSVLFRLLTDCLVLDLNLAITIWR